MSQYIKILHVPYIFIGLFKSLLIRSGVAPLFKEFFIIRISRFDQVYGANNKVKRLLSDIIPIVFPQMRLKTDLRSDSYRNPSAVLFPQFTHTCKILLYIKGPFISFTYVIMILMICDTYRIQTFFDSALYHFLRFRIRIQRKPGMHMTI